MIVGVPKEIKNNEYRVGITPAGARELKNNGHQLLIQSSAGDRLGFTDKDYRVFGADIVSDIDTVYTKSEMIVKVKEPQREECLMLRENQILFTYLHLAPDPEQTELLVKSGAICIAYETVTSSDGTLPLLAPMSEVAGRLSVQAGVHYLETSHGGSGMLLGGVPGTPPAYVVILGGGVVGINSAKMAIGFGARVVIIDKSLPRLRYLSDIFGSRAELLCSNESVIEEHCKQADLVIGGVLIPGASAPKLLRKKYLSMMKPGSVIVDVAIDQGGCFETSKATTHKDPVYKIDGIIHYCVANMPGAVPKTSTLALTNATLPYVMQLADRGVKDALMQDKHFLNGLNVAKGKVCHTAVCESLNYDYVEPSTLLH